jgi:hypothetical protein
MGNFEKIRYRQIGDRMSERDLDVSDIPHRVRRSTSSVTIAEPHWELRRAAEGMCYWIPAFSVEEKSAAIRHSVRKYRRARAARASDRRRKMATALAHIYDLYVYFITRPGARANFLREYRGVIATREFDADLGEFLVCCYLPRSAEGTVRWANALKEAVRRYTEVGMFAWTLGYRAPIMRIQNPMPTTIKAMADAYTGRLMRDKRKEGSSWRSRLADTTAILGHNTGVYHA